MATSFNKTKIAEINISKSSQKWTVPEKIVSIPSAASTTKFQDSSVVPAPASTEKYDDIDIDLASLRESIKNTAETFTELPSISQNTLNEDISKRIEQVREDNVEGKKYSVGIYDIDDALGFYFKNIIKPSIIENGEVKFAEIMYGNPERWAVMQKFGYYRDSKGKLILPLIMYRKSNIAKNDNLIFPRLDVTQLSYVTKKKWNVQNRYDKFNVLTQIPNSKPIGYHLTAIPNYVIVTYECIIWTAFVEQLNGIIEKINFSDGTYWGDKNKFKFRTMIDSYSPAVDISSESERIIKTTFNLNVYGYVLPEDFNNRNTTELAIAPKKIIFTVHGDEKIDVDSSVITDYDANIATVDLDFNNSNIPNYNFNG